eukprot:jgi/Chrzof1/4497/Cz14g15160.t1
MLSAAVGDHASAVMTGDRRLLMKSSAEIFIDVPSHAGRMLLAGGGAGGSGVGGGAAAAKADALAASAFAASQSAILDAVNGAGTARAASNAYFSDRGGFA